MLSLALSQATFLLGVYEQAYFGVGAGWSGAGEGACSAWLHPSAAGVTGAAPPKEYTNALGPFRIFCVLKMHAPG